MTPKRRFQHTWQCAGCGVIFDLVTEVEQRHLDRCPNPAVYIALEKSALERTAAIEHARRGCARPV